MKKLAFLLLFIGSVFISTSITYARSGCCSHHGGVCGNSCCDGSALSAVCGGGGGSYYYRSYAYCPANSYSVSGQCRCNEGYTPNVGLNRCEWDYQYWCTTKYPGTTYDKGKNMCICPSGNPLAWNPDKRSCPATDLQCQNQYGNRSIASGFDCMCQSGYVRSTLSNNTQCVSISVYYDTSHNENTTSNTQKDDSGIGWIGWGIILLAAWRFIVGIKKPPQ